MIERRTACSVTGTGVLNSLQQYQVLQYRVASETMMMPGWKRRKTFINNCQKYITCLNSCSNKTHHIAVSNSPAFPCWTDAHVLRYSWLTLVQAKQHMRHTVNQTNSLMHVEDDTLSIVTHNYESIGHTSLHI
jgi:hypothetical protein